LTAPLPYRHRLTTPLVRALILLSAAGCGPGQGHVSGTVLLDGKPLPGGIVTFVPSNNRFGVVTVELDETGNYGPIVLPAGETIVSVDNRKYAPPPPRGGPVAPPPGLSPAFRSRMSAPAPRSEPAPNPAVAARYVRIPERYYQSETSGLTITVGTGDQRHDIKLSK
jgi:hypothetical protein